MEAVPQTDDYKCFTEKDFPQIMLAFKKEKSDEEINALLSDNRLKAVLKIVQDILNKTAQIKLDLGDNFKVTFLMLAAGKEYSETVKQPNKRGLCGAEIPQLNNQLLTLCVDEGFFERMENPNDIETKTALAHEAAHVIHSAYFKKDFCACEGFAEVLPHYLLDFESKNLAHKKAIFALKSEDMLSLFSLNSPQEELNKNQVTQIQETATQSRYPQQSRPYLSAYLWMLGYIKRVEKQHVDVKGKTPKERAVKATNLVLKKFSNTEFFSRPKRIKELADFIGLKSHDLLFETTLQQEGKTFLIHQWNTVRHLNQEMQSNIK